MASHVIVGASRGIGYAFLERLAQDPSNTVIGLVRSVNSTQQKIDADNLTNVTILAADLDNYQSLLDAAAKVSALTSGSLDYLWINGANLASLTAERFWTDFSPEEHSLLVEDLQAVLTTNAIGVINATNAFLPLTRKSTVKKVITISSGMADPTLVTGHGIWEGSSYSVSKAAANMVVAKYDAKLRPEGILFLAVSPGLVDTGATPPESSQLPLKFASYHTSLRGPITPDQSVDYMLKLVDSCTPEKDGGQFYSHLGKHQGWLNSQ